MSLARSILRRVRVVFAAVAMLAAVPAFAQPLRYEFDPAFNGNFWIDAFTTGETSGAARYGSRIVRLPDGDVVVAGLVRLDNDPLAAPYWNIGLLRLSPVGTRQVWSGSGPYFHAGNQYVVYPNLAGGASGTATISKLADFAYANGRFYVLVRSHPAGAPGDRDVQLYVFADSGVLLNVINVLSSNADENAIALDVRETGLVANPVAIAVLGTVSGIRGAIAKFLVNANGNIQFDTSFGGGDGRVEFVMLPTECTYADCEFGLSDIAFPQSGGSGSSLPIYISGSVRRNSPSSTDFDMVIWKYTASGQLDTSFDSNGIRQYAFDLPNSSLADFSTALIVQRSAIGNFDTVWMSGRVAGSCTQVGGVIRADGATGAPTSGFGVAGRVTFGSRQYPPGEPCEEPADLVPTSLLALDGDIVVGATASIPVSGSPPVATGVLASLTGTSGALLSLDYFPLDGGPGPTYSRIDSIVAGEGGGRVYAAGSGATDSYNSLFLVARLKPGDDTVFRDGFE